MSRDEMPDPSSAGDPFASPVPPSPGSPEFPVVGVGASAGGIPALLRFFEHMPDSPGMAFVVVLHLSPKHESVADQILQRVTRMRVMQVRSTTRIETNCVYLISPSNDLSMVDGTLRVSAAKRPYGRPVAIDLFFRTLAEVHGTRAFCVVLSGTGSDGAVGISRIKECAGLTLVQSPEDAQYDEMPRAAIATGMVDFTLPVNEIPRKLIALWHNARAIKLPEAASVPDLAETANRSALMHAQSSVHGILTTLQRRTGHDFRHYKRATVLRRIERRMQVNALADLAAYQEFLDANVDETPALLKDMLIGVTNFFRDREAFESLEHDVISALFEARPTDDQVRAWVAGCSTGEEVYSLAMLLSERAQQTPDAPEIQIFGTDIDERAIDTGRAGSYPESILADVSARRLRQFFTHSRARYVVNKALRERVLFAAHNILRDPPFSRLDLVSCRNLLIYLDRTVQRQILQMFHFALKPGGFLFLGNAESAEAADDLFTAVDKKHRIYRAKILISRPRTRSPAPVAGRISQPWQPTVVKPEVRHSRSSPADLHQRVREFYAQPSVLVDKNGEILHMSEQATHFLRYVGGEPTHNLLTLINPDLRLEVRTALFQALQHGKSVDARRVRFARGSINGYVNISVRPFRETSDGAEVVLISFDEIPEADPRDDSDSSADKNNPVVTQLEEELHRVKEQLLLSAEQSSVSNEELKASNEELQAIVEELRSASEELETSKEELQSVNEELTTVNGELEAKVNEADKANDDLENLIVSTGIATIFVDRALRIKRYTAPAVALFNLIESDVGRPLLDLTHRLEFPELASDAAVAFEQLRVTEREVRSHEGRWFLARLLPYRTLDDRIDGAVLTLIDVTERRQAQAEARTSEDRLKLAALATDDYGIIVQDVDGVIVSWNKGATRVFGYEENEVVGKPIDVVFSAGDRAEGVPRAERERADGTGRAEDERWHVRRDGTEIYCSGVTTPIDAQTFKGYAKIVRDVTDRKSVESQQQLQLALERAVRAQAEASNRLKDEFFAVLSHELKNPLNLIHVKAELLTRVPDARDIPVVRDAADAIKRSVVSQAKIIDDLLDLSRARTGKLALNLALVDLAAVVRAVADASDVDAAAGGIRLTVRGADSEVRVHADAVRVEQIVWNLVRNALKFTPRGGDVTLTVSRSNGIGSIEVADTGQGIAPAFLPRIFDMFSQEEGGGKRDRGGLGIGLSLVKQLAEMQGGMIEARSDGLGRGAFFRLSLPEMNVLAAIGTPPGAGNPAIFEGLRILLVDDALEALDALRTLLELEGAIVHAVNSGERALSAVTEHDFDLILSDIGMPTMNGYELVRRLRASARTEKAIIIAVTGFGRKQDVAEALKAGFDGHLAKPVPLERLLTEVARLSESRR